jgi:hypothetical protein
MTRPTIHLRPTLLSALLLVSALGCHGSASSSSSNSAAEQAKPNYNVIHVGHAPTSVLVPNGGRLQIVDVGTDRTNPTNKVILDTNLPTNARVTLNPDGVTINAQRTGAKGPYPRNHTYEFRLFR